MSKVKKKVHEIYVHFLHDSLYRNSITLMIDTGLLGVFGFVFWYLGAHLYSQTAVGIATTLISSSVLIASISVIGFDNSFTRYMKHSNNPQQLYRTGVTVVCLTATALSSLYVLFLPHLTNQLNIFSSNLLYPLSFIALVIFASLNTITNGVFLSFRSAKYILYSNVNLSIVKVVLPFILVSIATLGLYLSHVVGMVVGAFTSLYYIKKKYKHTLKFNINKTILKEVAKYNFFTHFSNLFQNAPMQIVPLIIASKLNLAQSAAFYLAVTTSNLLYIIPNAISSSLFAEVSHDSSVLRAHIARALKLLIIILAPILLLAIVLSDKLMLVFGSDYVVASTQTFKILALSIIFVSINIVASGILKATNHTRALFNINFLGAVVFLLLTLGLVQKGLVAVAWTWFFTQAIVSLMFISTFYGLKIFHKTPIKIN